VLVYEGKVEVGLSDGLKEKLAAQKQAAQENPGERYEVQGPTEVAGPQEVSLETWISIVAGQQIFVKKDGQYDKFEFDQDKDKMLEWVNFNTKKDEQIKE
jgi:hypothetical protein